MDRAIAYKLKPAQAVAFYVQSAALTECDAARAPLVLRELFSALSGSTTDPVTYGIPNSIGPRF